MDYLTRFYKNQAESLAEQVARLENELKMLSESEAPASTFRGTGSGQQRFSDLELETQMRRNKRTGFLGAEVPDEKQSREYLDAKAELERRRGAQQTPAPAPARAPAPAPAPARRPAPAPRPPVEQTGPVGSPSAVPTRTEVQRTQAVANATQMPTALPTNVAPGTMSMTDMDGNPIAVQPDTGKTLGRVQAGPSKEERKDLEDSAMNKGAYAPGKAPAPTAPAPANSGSAAPGADMVSRAFSVPARAPGTMTTPSDIHGGRLQPDFHDGRIEPKVDADVQASAPPGRWSGNWNDFINSMRIPAKPSQAPAPAPAPARRPAPTTAPPVPANLYGTPPSGQFAPNDSSLATNNPSIGGAVEPRKPREIQNTPRPDQAAIDSAARQAIPAPRPLPKPAPAPAKEEDFSKFWAGKPRYGDLELQNMMRQFKKTTVGAAEIPDERQPMEYRAAKAELRRRGKIK